MCGIFGCVGAVDEALMQRMEQSLLHRGPDGGGKHIGPGVYLGHRRLSIIDITGGAQPMYNEDKSLAVIYNGEIYNFQALRSELEAAGHVFQCESDTEIIVHAYEEWGKDSFTRFNGIFAFALWDMRREELLLVRDRLGVKPLYYRPCGRDLLFASELATLLQARGMGSIELDPDKVSEFMVFRHAGGGRTLLKGLHKLEPGCWMSFRNGEIRIRRYWELEYAPHAMSEEEAVQGFLERFRNAVHSQLVADVPLGVMLSGGIDSGGITAMAAEQSERLKTFSIGFKDDPMSELDDARGIAAHFNTEHHELVVSPSDLKLVPEIIRRNDEPVAGPSSLAYYLMLERVREAGVKVVLLGHGADEIASGYEHLRMLAKLKKLRESAFRPAVSAALAVGRAVFPSDDCIVRTGRLFRDAFDVGRAYLDLYAVFAPFELPGLLQGEYCALAQFDPLGPFLRQGLEPHDAIMAYEFGPWLADDLLHRVDRMSMAHSIEGRVPFLDNELVTFCAKTPYAWKYGPLGPKHLFKRAMEGLLPQTTVQRKKQRFTTPVDRLFGKGLLDACSRLFTEKNELNETVFDTGYLQRLLAFRTRPSYSLLLRRHRLLAQYYARQVWSVFAFQIWHKTVVLGEECGYLFETSGGRGE